MIDINYEGLTGKVVTNKSTSYDADRQAWNRAIEKHPLVIVYCYEKEDVINAVRWAREKSLDIRIRSGAHHYEGYSTGDGVVVIDVSQMQEINIDEENKLVKISGGVRNREIYEALGEKEYPFPGGGCPTVGVTGLVLGGGWGYSSRLFGLASDGLIELEMVDYKGDLIIANESINEDLFWACRGGGGGNFGIIVSMTFGLSEKRKMTTLINIEYLHITKEETIKIIEVLQNSFKTWGRNINIKTAIYNSKEKGRGVKITGLMHGSLEETSIALKDFKNISDKAIFKLEHMPLLEANRVIQDSHPDFEKYKSTGRFVCKDYSREEIEKIIETVENVAEGSTYAAISFYGLGGAVEYKDKQSTAFYYRDAKFIMGIQSVWEEDKYSEGNKSWIIDRFEFIKTITEGSYINFPLGELEDYEAEYYGENKYKLREVKAKYDPYNIFSFKQGIKIEKEQLLNCM